MSRNYYITQPGRIRRKDNTIYLEPEDAPRIPIPVEDIDALYFYGELDLNTKLLNFLAQKKIAFHVFNYYGYYSGSYYPREYLNSGSLLVKQVQHYEKPTKRMTDRARVRRIRCLQHAPHPPLSYQPRQGL